MTYEATNRNDRGAYDGSAAPCETCTCKPLCARESLACGALSHWTNAGSNADLSGPRFPNRRTFQRMFPNGLAAISTREVAS